MCFFASQGGCVRNRNLSRPNKTQFGKQESIAKVAFLIHRTQTHVGSHPWANGMANSDKNNFILPSEEGGRHASGRRPEVHIRYAAGKATPAVTFVIGNLFHSIGRNASPNYAISGERSVFLCNPRWMCSEKEFKLDSICGTMA